MVYLYVFAGIVGVLLMFFIVVAGISYGVFAKTVATKKVSPLDPNRWNDPQLKKFAEEGLKCQKWLLSQGYETPEIRSFDGLKLKALLVTPEIPSAKVVITVHGYRSRSLYNFPNAAVFYRNSGYNVLMLDNRGHGESDGKFKTFAVLDRFDVRQWIDYAVEKFGADCEIVLHGVSMGAAAVMLVSEMFLPSNVKGIIADCGFTSGWDQMSYNMKNDYHAPPSLFMPFVNMWCKLIAKFDLKSADTRTALEHTSTPVLFIHGKKDFFVPVSMTESNYAHCKSEKQLALFENGIHARSYASDPELYEKTVSEFLKKYCRV